MTASELPASTATTKPITDALVLLANVPNTFPTPLLATGVQNHTDPKHSFSTVVATKSRNSILISHPISVPINKVGFTINNPVIVPTNKGRFISIKVDKDVIPPGSILARIS